MKRPVSIKDIARLAGVSVATVSRVINQNGRFSTETEARVRRVIAETGYRPNLLARSLRTSRARVVGIIMPDITNEFFAGVTLELQNNLLAMGYSAIICNTQGDDAVELKYHILLQSQQISGLIYLCGKSLPELPMLDIPIVYIDRDPLATVHTHEFAVVTSDSRNGGYLATSELLQKGCHIIAMITPGRGESLHENRIKGYQAALEEAGIPFDRELLLFADSISIQQGSYLSRHLFETYPEIDGLFCAADPLAYGAMDYLNKIGRSVPGNVRVIGYDDLSYSALCGLTSIKLAAEDFGGIGAELLISMIEEKPLASAEYALPVSLVTRASTR